MAEAIRRAVEEAVYLERPRGPDLPALGIRAVVTVSIGVADVHGLDLTDGADAGSLIRGADAAMYRVKDAGKNSVVIARPGHSDG